MATDFFVQKFSWEQLLFKVFFIIIVNLAAFSSKVNFLISEHYNI